MDRFRNSDQFKAFIRKEAKRLNISVPNAYSTFISRSFLEKQTMAVPPYEQGTLFLKTDWLYLKTTCKCDQQVMTLQNKCSKMSRWQYAQYLYANLYPFQEAVTEKKTNTSTCAGFQHIIFESEELTEARQINVCSTFICLAFSF